MCVCVCVKVKREMYGLALLPSSCWSPFTRLLTALFGLSFPRLLSRSSKALSILKVALWPHALGGWDPAQVEEEGVQAAEAVSFSMRWPPTLYCHVCKKHSFPSQLKPGGGKGEERRKRRKDCRILGVRESGEGEGGVAREGERVGSKRGNDCAQVKTQPSAT